jgi:hypothetical protein
MKQSENLLIFRIREKLVGLDEVVGGVEDYESTNQGYFPALSHSKTIFNAKKIVMSIMTGESVFC